MCLVIRYILYRAPCVLRLCRVSQIENFLPGILYDDDLFNRRIFDLLDLFFDLYTPYEVFPLALIGARFLV